MSVSGKCDGCRNSWEIDFVSYTCPEDGSPECKEHQKQKSEETRKTYKSEKEKLVEELTELSMEMLQRAKFFRETDPMLSFYYYKRSETCRLAANALAARKEGK